MLNRPDVFDIAAAEKQWPQRGRQLQEERALSFVAISVPAADFSPSVSHHSGILSLPLFSWLHKLLFSSTSLLAGPHHSLEGADEAKLSWLHVFFMPALRSLQPASQQPLSVVPQHPLTPDRCDAVSASAASLIHWWHLEGRVNPWRKGQVQTVPGATQWGPLTAI